MSSPIRLSSEGGKKIASMFLAGHPDAAIHVVGAEDPTTAGKALTFELRSSDDNEVTWTRVFKYTINIPDGGGSPPVVTPVVTPISVTPVMPADGRPQLEKGASIDANTWKVVAMKDDPSLYKIVDSANTNVADQFHTMTTAQQYIDYYKATGGVVVPTPPSGGGGGTGGDGGPSVPGKRLYTPKTGGRIKTAVNTSGSQGASSGIRYNILSDPTLVNRESTFIGQVKEVVDHSHDHWSLKCGSHGGEGEGCALLEVQQDWAGGKGKLQTESPHPQYHQCSGGTTFDVPPFPFNKTVAIKFCSWQDGSGGMWFQYWYDFGDGVASDNFSWKKYAELHYTGSACSPVTANDLGASGSIKGPAKTQDTARWNGANTTAWTGEIVEIDPPATPL